LALSASARAAAYAAVETAIAAKVLVSFDLNYRSALWSRSEAMTQLMDMARRVDLIFGGEDELAMLGEDEVTIATSLVSGTGKTVVVKRGDKGASAVDHRGPISEPALPVDMVDPVGAGDAFVAGYLASLLDGASTRQRLKMGCAVGACAVSSLGDWEALPTREDLAHMGASAGTTLR
jgi:2-dehydro-3-deoxygluconokinase